MIMSSNAFARSRPRVRHQRVPRTVPRTHSCDHPRFLQLVDELTRTNDIKKKQQEIEGKNDCSSSTDDDSPAPSINASSDTSACVISNTTTTSTNNNCNLSTCSVSSINSSNASSSNIVSSTNPSILTDDVLSSRNSITSAINDNVCSGVNLNTIGTCCNSITTSNMPHAPSNIYRSLDSNQPSSTSALHDNYLNHSHNQPSIQQHHSHHNHQLLNQNDRQHLSQQQHQVEDRCPGKTTDFGYSKQNLLVQNSSNSDHQNNSNNPNNNINDNSNSDLRQDENRSKRKRSANDCPSLKKSSSICGSNFGSSENNKKHKSAPESFTTCPICLLDCIDRNPSFTNTCFHLFCYVCIENWTKNKTTCPLCRTKFTKIIHKIKSTTEYEEKVASPIRRDEDDRYERLTIEHLSDFNSNSNVSNRNANSGGFQFLFEEINTIISRNPEVLVVPRHFVNQMDPRQNDSLNSFNTVTTTSNFNTNAPHPPFTNTSYPITPTNYIVDTLLPPNRIAPMTSTAITSAYSANSSLTSINNESGFRRISRSMRPIYRNNYDTSGVDSSGRVTRASNTALNQPGVPVERHHHNQHYQHSNYQQHHPHHRPTIDMSLRNHNPRIEQAHPAQIPAPYFNPQNMGYPRRPYSNPQLDYSQQLDIIYRNLPDMQ